MSSRYVKQAKQQCWRKRPYQSDDIAQGVIDQLNKNGKQPGLHPYFCTFCFKYHIGHDKAATG